jgi:hypothetical protein
MDKSAYIPQNDSTHSYSNDERDLDWAYQNQLRKKWLEDNPNAEYEGWMSI